jgi:hypothetical protein
MSNLLARSILVALLSCVAPGLNAATEAELETLFDAIGAPELMQIMREEGLEQAEDLRDEMFPGRGGSGWTAIAGRVYDTDRMTATLRAKFDAELADTDIAPLVQFFTSERGREIVRLELEGRRALMQPGVEDAARETFERLEDDADPRVGQIQRFVVANDLIELNVMGAMNASLAFFQGMAAGGGFDLGEEQMLSEVWSQEADIRDDTTGWLYAYLIFAYQPLDDADLDAYSALSETAAGRGLNRALFAGFDRVFVDISFSLGQAVSQFMTSEDL